MLAAGLSQAAVILAQKPPIPQYFKGREGGPAEYAMVAEKGPELITGRSGGQRLVSTPQITYLQAGDTVHTAEKTRRLLANPPLLSDPAARSRREALNTVAHTARLRQDSAHTNAAEKVAQNRELASLIVQGMAGVLDESFAKRPQFITEPEGMFLYTKTRNGVTKHLNQRHRRHGS